jgi:hypothetical protein
MFSALRLIFGYFLLDSIVVVIAYLAVRYVKPRWPKWWEYWVAAPYPEEFE